MTTLDRVLDIGAFTRRLATMDTVERKQVREGWLTNRETLFGPVIYPTFRSDGYHVIEDAPDGRWVEACIESTAGLCASWPNAPSTPGASMGAAIGSAMLANPGALTNLQFIRLIGSHEHDLVSRLRYVIPRVASSATITPDWGRLLQDLVSWPDPLSDVKPRWVNDQLDAELGPA